MSNPNRKAFPGKSSAAKGHGNKNGPVRGAEGKNPGSGHGGAYWLYGLHPVRAALGNPRRKVLRIALTQPASEKLASSLHGRQLRIDIVSPQEIERLLPPGAVHQGAAMEVLPLAELSLEHYLARTAEKRLLLILDQVTDPHNVGAILRSAAAFEAGAVIVPRDHAPQESAVLAKASSGGIEIVPFITVTNLASCMETLKKNGYWCIGLTGEAKKTIAEAKLGQSTALVLGAEGSGLRRLTQERCDMLVRLPISPMMESLNVSNAAAIALYALAGQRE
jgi:23S rRNA (guanosine2251-2'-O)-methyltransferase